MKVIASHNGLAAAERAFARLRAGVPPLEAVVEGVGLIEDDPEETTVGYGGAAWYVAHAIVHTAK